MSILYLNNGSSDLETLRKWRNQLILGNSYKTCDWKESVEGWVIGENGDPTQRHFLQCTHQLCVILHLEKGTGRMDKKIRYQYKYSELHSSQSSTECGLVSDNRVSYRKWVVNQSGKTIKLPIGSYSIRPSEFNEKRTKLTKPRDPWKMCTQSAKQQALYQSAAAAGGD